MAWRRLGADGNANYFRGLSSGVLPLVLRIHVCSFARNGCRLLVGHVRTLSLWGVMSMIYSYCTIARMSIRSIIVSHGIYKRGGQWMTKVTFLICSISAAYWRHLCLAKPASYLPSPLPQLAVGSNFGNHYKLCYKPLPAFPRCLRSANVRHNNQLHDPIVSSHSRSFQRSIFWSNLLLQLLATAGGGHENRQGSEIET